MTMTNVSKKLEEDLKSFEKHGDVIKLYKSFSNIIKDL